MTPRERVVRTLTFEPVDRPPRNLWTLPGIPMLRKEELTRFMKNFQDDIAGPGVLYAKGDRESGIPNAVGRSVDAWGCEFEVLEPGIIGEVKRPLFGDGYDALSKYEAPWETLCGLNRGAVALNCAQTDAFVLAGTQTRPFERMQFLRGTENLFCDLALNDPESYVLRDKLHEFFVAEMRFWASTPVDGVSFMDDWGTQRSMLISPEKWRAFYKPLYREYCDILRSAGKFVFFHSDGFIEDIYPDLVEIGVNAVNSQLFCMNIEELGRKYAGKIAFWGEIDRQHILPFGSETDCRSAVRRAHRALCPSGELTGVFAQCEWGLNVPYENICAVFDEWNFIS